MDAVELLTQQHREVEALFDRFEQTNDDQGRLELATTIVRELRAHTTIEEELFYPRVRREGDEELEAAVLEDLEEHHAVEMLLDELEGVDAGDERFVAKVTVIKELVEHHVEEEESEQFPKVREALGEEALADLGERMTDRYEQLTAEAEADAKTKEELYQAARDLGISGRAQMSKRQLAAAVRQAREREGSG